MSNYNLFLEGFAEAANLTIQKAGIVWASWSTQLSDQERRKIEELGYDSGKNEGAMYFTEWQWNLEQ
jgi:hypothetical protein